jgi:hypothetical protein
MRRREFITLLSGVAVGGFSGAARGPADFYNHIQHIADMVDDNNSVKAIYYPERQYKDAHKKNPNKAKVHGHDVLQTFADAADIVSNILNDSTYAPPDVTEGHKFKDD